jgi:anti-sigma factor ChrR (cupin superfamily)
MAAEPQVVWMPGGVRTEIHLRAEETGGAFCLLVDEPPAGWSLPPHRHGGVAETIHIVDGEFDMEVDGKRFSLGAVPRADESSSSRRAGWSGSSSKSAGPRAT